jgi:squalene-associated FAD-dependent desaturase
VARSVRVAVIGGGWAGLAAAVEATSHGAAVTVFEMSPRLGGRARDVAVDGQVLDNGQHILIGAYTETLRLMQRVGVDLGQALLRMPLRLADAEGVGLHLDPGAPVPAFAMAVLKHRRWRLRDRLALLRAAAGWALRGFTCEPTRTVASLTASLPVAVRNGLIDPLCVAALNTPSDEASASVFLRVLKDALFSGPGSADLLLPRASLGELFPAPAAAWLIAAGAAVRTSQRVDSLRPADGAWRIGDEAFDQVVMATPPGEAARLTRTLAPGWSEAASALHYEPIVTVYLRATAASLPAPMLSLPTSAAWPAQFVFDRGQLGGPRGLLAFVISGAQPWVERGADATVEATLDQARATLARQLGGPLTLVKTLTEKRATFRCTPGLRRPPMQVLPGLNAAGDHIAGPYPATLEGAVRSGVAAVAGVTGARTAPPAARR